MGAGAGYTVRGAVAHDLLGVVRLVDHAPDLPVDGLTQRQLSVWNRMLATPDLTIYVAELEGKAVGTTSLLLMPHLTYDCQPTGFIEAMVVLEAHRRRGIGRMMVERVLNDARASGCRKIQVMSHKRHADDGALDFYRSLGFIAEAEGFRIYL
jgi:GNAT superfamily N-acetyltransferase